MRTLVVPSERSIKAAKATTRAAVAYPNMPSRLKPPFKDIYVITGPLFLPSKEPAAPAVLNGGVVASEDVGYIRAPCVMYRLGSVCVAL